MGFFNFGKKKKDKSKDDKKKDNKTREDEPVETPQTHMVSGSAERPPLQLSMDAFDESYSACPLPAPSSTFTMDDLSIPDITELFTVFHATLSQLTDTHAKRSTVKKIRAFCTKMVEEQTSVTKADILDSFLGTGMDAFMEAVRAEPAGRRARHALAMYRFCGVLEQEYEQDALGCSTGFLASLRGGILGGQYSHNASLTAPVVPPPVPEVPPCETLDLPRIYRSLVSGKSRNYLPTAPELNEILKRVSALLRARPNVEMVPLPSVVVGDIHGQIKDVLNHVIPTGGPLVSEAALAEFAHSLKPQSKKQQAAASGGSSNNNNNKDSSAPSEGDKPKAKPEVNYVFLGDYVDRGDSSLQCMCLLFVAKLMCPASIFLLRGNHECALTNRHYGFLEECHKMYPIVNGKVTTSPLAEGKQLKGGADDGPEASSAVCMDWDLSDHPLWLAANEAFMCLPLCAVMYHTPPEDSVTAADAAVMPGIGAQRYHNARIIPRVAAMHGGLSPHIDNSLDGIIAINRFKEIEGGPLADLTWSDPMANTVMSSTNINTDSSGGLTTEHGSPLLLQSANSLDTSNMDMAGDNKNVRRVQFDFSAPVVYNGPPIGYTFSSRGTGHNFGEDITCAFLQVNQLRFLVRAHQCVQEGYQWVHQHRLLTVFSAPNYCGIGNKGSVLLLDAEGNPSIAAYEFCEEKNNGSNNEAGGGAPVPPKGFL